MDTAIQKTSERLDFLSQDKETLRRYDLRQMGIMDWNSVIYEKNEAEKLAEKESTARKQAEERAGQAEAALAKANRRIAELEAKK
jgi:hypothetical protein